MPQLKLYWNIQSQPSRAVKSLLLAGDVTHESIHLDILKNEHKSPEILEINPTGVVPFITVDGDTLWESAVVLRYLSNKFPSLHQYYECFDNGIQAQIDGVMDWNGQTYRNAQADSFIPIVFAGIKGKNPDTAALAMCKEATEKTLPKLYAFWEQQMKKHGTSYLVGNTITIADFQLYCQTTDIFYKGACKSLDAYPMIKAWFDLVGQHKGIKDIHEGKEFLDRCKMVQKYYFSGLSKSGLTGHQEEEWIKLTKKAMAARTWANSMCTPQMIKDCDVKIRAARTAMMKTHEGREAMKKRITEVWNSLLPSGSTITGEEKLGWEQIRKMAEIFAPEIDKINAPHENAHWVWEEETAKAAYDYGAKIFGSEDCKYTLQQWFTMMSANIRYVEPFAEPKHLTVQQVQEWVKVSKAALAARKWANSMWNPQMIFPCDLKIRAHRDAMFKSQEGREKFRNRMMEIWDQLCTEGSEELGWEQLSKMGAILAPDIDKINAPHEDVHWVQDDVTAKAAFEYAVKIFGSADGKYTLSQWFAMMFAYNRNIKPFTEPPTLTKEQVEEWVQLQKEAMAARTWANPMCTPQMIIDCDLKIRASRDYMKKIKEERERFMNKMSEAWTQLSPPGHDDLGFDEMKKLMQIFNADIDKVNAPHENAHWNWDDTTSRKVYDYVNKIYGSSDGTYTLPQWFGRQIAFDRSIEPFVEPKQLSPEQIKTWVELTKNALAARKWSVPDATPEQIKEKVIEIQEKQRNSMDMLEPWVSRAFLTACKPGEHTMGWEGIKEIRDSFNGIDDERFGGHFIYEDATSKASFDFTVKIFGEYDGKISFGQWVGQVQSYMKNVHPQVMEQ